MNHSKPWPRTHLLYALVILLLAGPAGAANKSSTSKARSRVTTADTVETRINALHDDLKITPEQEPMWNQVAAVMRENAKGMMEAHDAEPANDNAVEELKSYGRIAEAHAQGVQKFTPAFESLYNSMTEVQKQRADDVMHQRVQEAAKRHK